MKLPELNGQFLPLRYPSSHYKSNNRNLSFQNKTNHRQIIKRSSLFFRRFLLYITENTESSIYFHLMMDSPYLRSHWNQPPRPRYSPAFGGIPLQQVQRRPSTTSSPKVVSIPVHFVQSETSQSASALKIQKVFRGFLVRKSVKKIASIKNEVDAMERRILQTETVELIRCDPKERVRVNETLMALLFKLDSVRGVDSGVRDCRKAVIKKAIALQEKVDAIVSTDNETLCNANDDGEAVELDDSDAIAEAVVDQTLEIKDSSECLIDDENVADQTLEECRGKILDVKDSASVSIECSFDCKNCLDDQTLETERMPLEVEDPTNWLTDSNRCENAVVKGIELFGSSSGKPEAKEDGVNSLVETCENKLIPEIGLHSEVKADEERCVVKEMVENRNTTPSMGECVEENVEKSPTTENWSEYSADLQSLKERGEENTSVKLGDGMEVLSPGRTEDNKRDRELMEKMVEDNEKMMSLMTQLFEKNELQTRMLTSLTHRVERLEKAFVCDKLRKKKKRHAVCA